MENTRSFLQPFFNAAPKISISRTSRASRGRHRSSNSNSRNNRSPVNFENLRDLPCAASREVSSFQFTQHVPRFLGHPSINRPRTSLNVALSGRRVSGICAVCVLHGGEGSERLLSPSQLADRSSIPSPIEDCTSSPALATPEITKARIDDIDEHRIGDSPIA